MARNAETGVSKSALTDFTTGTSVASFASWVNCLKSGCSIVCDLTRLALVQSQFHAPERVFHYRRRRRAATIHQRLRRTRLCLLSQAHKTLVTCWTLDRR